MKILLLASAFNGLTQRVWCTLREQGHEVGVELAPAHAEPESLIREVERIDPDLILCPFLKHRVPEEVWRRWTTVIVHPGPVGDRGPSSLDHTLLGQGPRWGVTALSAVEEMDAGPIWATSTFEVPEGITKSALYNSRVADAAMECVETVVRKVAAGARPVPAEEHPRAVPGTGELPLLRRAAFALDWRAPARDLARRIAAADGAPGAPVDFEGRTYCLFDAVPTDEDTGASPGTIVGRDCESIAFATGRGTLWVGYAALLERKRGPKLPAAMVIDASAAPFRAAPQALAESVYRRDGDIGFLTIRSYNGAMHTEQCRRLTAAVEKALAEDTRILVVTGTEHAFSNGIHLGVIDAAPDPAAEAWANINAIDELCLAIAQADQLTVAAFSANAGAGGVMTGLCADVTVARDGVVLNPYYDMGIYGSELHTWSVADRVGASTAARLLGDKLPISADEAARIGLIGAVGPRDWNEFQRWLRAVAVGYNEPVTRGRMYAAKARRRAEAKPMSYYQTIELAEMARDMFDDRHGFHAKRRAFLGKAAPTETPAKLRFR
ncbi:formyl transferase [Glycomyces sp. TRM65418]|uniref:enoyl-CoA hydratase-related protein n=1 Tax=Glycomyces sp. TRM65418 TaxID=2867006 RepID=UPI001CE54DB3|nr:enoyl-CoA hydratase-related protein [Glycomyces sp. TRM65418]MCC3765237.1 formyl transferase [Glycomyces sp. TRM65418]QZD54858.1 formyl transferase [Glycomyces sp. TRM65418]